MVKTKTLLMAAVFLFSLVSIAAAQYTPIPNFTGTLAGQQFRNALNNKLNGSDTIAPQVTHLNVSGLPGTAVNGQLYYADDGTPGSVPCTGGGTGSFVQGVNGVWSCQNPPLGLPVSASNGGRGCGGPTTLGNVLLSDPNPQLGDICMLTDVSPCVAGATAVSTGGSGGQPVDMTVFDGQEWVCGGTDQYTDITGVATGTLSGTGTVIVPCSQVALVEIDRAGVTGSPVYDLPATGCGTAHDILFHFTRTSGTGQPTFTSSASGGEPLNAVCSALGATAGNTMDIAMFWDNEANTWIGHCGGTVPATAPPVVLSTFTDGSAYSPLTSDQDIDCNCSSGACVVDLPQAQTAVLLRDYYIKNISSSEACTIHPFSGDSIDGSTSDITIAAASHIVVHLHEHAATKWDNLGTGMSSTTSTQRTVMCAYGVNSGACACSTGTCTYTPDSGTTSFDATIVGSAGGGGGAQSGNTSVCSGGGGTGGAMADWLVQSVIEASYTIVLGAGGAAGTCSSSATNAGGQPVSTSLTSSNWSTTLQAQGSTGAAAAGSTSASGCTGGAGGVANSPGTNQISATTLHGATVSEIVANNGAAGGLGSATVGIGNARSSMGGNGYQIPAAGTCGATGYIPATAGANGYAIIREYGAF